MAGHGQKKQLAVDTNLLLDLARKLDFAHELREVFQSVGYTFVAGPTVFEELGYASLFGVEPERSLARKAVAQAASWGVLAFDLSGVQAAIAARFAERLLEQRLLPEDEFNDALILAETSLAGIPMLVTSDKHLLHMDDDALALAFNDADLPPVHPVNPKALLRALR